MITLRLSLVVPCYDEEAVIEGTLRALVAHLEGTHMEFEIVCVDDGSRDATRELLERAAAADARIRLLALPRNRGKGAAVRAGVLAARGERVFFLDADLATDLSALAPALERLEAGAGAVFGDRRDPRSRVVAPQPRRRERLGRGFSALARVLLAPAVQDFTCGFKGFRAEVAREVFERSRVDGWAFDAELAGILRARGRRVDTVPVLWSDGRSSKVRLPWAALASLRDLLICAARARLGTWRR